jgi:hypothetical protein
MSRSPEEDELWREVLRSVLDEYVLPVQEWWSAVTDLGVSHTGSYSIPGAPPGLLYRFTRIAVRSPIRGIQAFPYVGVPFLKLRAGIPGGVNKMISRVCRENALTLGEFTIIEKHGLPSMYNCGQCLCFVPTHVLENIDSLGHWIYLTETEMRLIADRIIPDSVVNKIVLKL